MCAPPLRALEFYTMSARLLFFVAAFGCTEITFTDKSGFDAATDDDASTDGPFLPDLGPAPDMYIPPQLAFVYAHSSSTLYQIDPDTLDIAMVGPFGWPDDGSDSMTDIAIDKDENMVGISFGNVYAVDKETAECTFLAALPAEFVGLSFLPGKGLESDDEILVGAAIDGSLVEIDPTTGANTPTGDYGGGYETSGDLVFVAGAGTFATVQGGVGTGDTLVAIDPASGVATPVGATGFAGIWGAGFWDGKVFGFTSGGTFLTIDPDTGGGTFISSQEIQWWGAGVTTRAPPGPD